MLAKIEYYSSSIPIKVWGVFHNFYANPLSSRISVNRLKQKLIIVLEVLRDLDSNLFPELGKGTFGPTL